MTNMIFFIKVWPSEQDEHGFMFDIFTTEADAEDETNSIDGGFCTTTQENAIGMAISQSLEHAKQNNLTARGFQIVLE